MWRSEEDQFSVAYAGLGGAFQPKLGHQSVLKTHKGTQRFDPESKVT